MSMRPKLISENAPAQLKPIYSDNACQTVRNCAPLPVDVGQCATGIKTFRFLSLPPTRNLGASRRGPKDDDEPSILRGVGQSDALVPLDQRCLRRCSGHPWYGHPLQQGTRRYRRRQGSLENHSCLVRLRLRGKLGLARRLGFRRQPAGKVVRYPSGPVMEPRSEPMSAD